MQAEGLNVLSCFDGLSGGQLALKKAGIKVNTYYASEIDKYAIAVARYNFPDTCHLGDIRKIDTSRLPQIDLMLAGSPCTDLSFAGNQKGLVEGEQSSLFFDWWNLVQELKPKYIFLENVRMRREYKDKISRTLGFEPVAINSSLVSAQSRYRLYWFGVRVGNKYVDMPINQPQDQGIVLRHILETQRETNIVCGAYRGRYYKDGVRQDQFGSVAGKTKQMLELRKDGKTNTITTVQKDNVLAKDEVYWRKLTVLECERLQTVPDGYTNYGMFDTVKPVSNSQRYKMLGNGWTIDVIAHIMEGLR